MKKETEPNVGDYLRAATELHSRATHLAAERAARFDAWRESDSIYSAATVIGVRRIKAARALLDGDFWEADRMVRYANTRRAEYRRTGVNAPLIDFVPNVLPVGGIKVLDIADSVVGMLRFGETLAKEAVRRVVKKH